MSTFNVWLIVGAFSLYCLVFGYLFGKGLEDLKQRQRVSKRHMSTSQEFNESFSGVGSIVMECGCGRTYFVSDGDYDDGELDELRKKASVKPLQFIERPGDSYVSAINVPGFGVIVRGCECRRDLCVEEFLRERQGEILDYYRRVLESEESKSKALRSGLDALESRGRHERA